MSPMLPFLLRSLKYFSPVNPDDAAQFQSVVVWLENMKIRLYPADGRLQLQSQDASEWQAALRKYLADIHCPTDAANQRAVLQWLAAHAVNLEYEDANASQQLNQLAQRVEAEAGPPEEWADPTLPPLPDVTSDAVRAALLQLQRLLHVEAGEASPEGLLWAHAMLESCVLPALAELAKQQQRKQGGQEQPHEPHQQQQQQQQQQQEPHDDVAVATAAAAGGRGDGAGSGSTAQQAAAAAMLAQYPLGFSTGDGGADLAATILRMLYIKDLRSLQTLVDSAIVKVQEHTANPRTDATLGRVGR